MKICCRCKKEKHESEFYRDRRNSDGLQGECRECDNIRGKKYYGKNKDRWRSDHYKEVAKRRREIVTQLWRTWLGEEFGDPVCEICGTPLQYLSSDQFGSVHFDHRNNGNEIIEDNPSVWLRGRAFTNSNKVLFKLCDFGILCFHCNKRLPTKDRRGWLKKVYDYVDSR